MVYHWQTQNVKLSGVDDMVLLPKISEEAIVDNLKKRYMDDYIFTYIGPVLISVNPFKMLPYFGDKEIEQYQGAAQYENPPHVYGLSDVMYRNMGIDRERQCVIISGESGAGKTVAAKYIMAYIARVSGGGGPAQRIKDVVLQSNPLLEAFGNAKTVRNNNSSRFGKYVELMFGNGGQPEGGKISNFLLEKSRVVQQNEGERNFHIFYQLCEGANEAMRGSYGIATANDYFYLSCGQQIVDDTNDNKGLQETLRAMEVMALNKQEQREILQVTAAILHMGNISFKEVGNYAAVDDKQSYPAHLLGIEEDQLASKLVSRKFDSKWGAQSDCIDVTLNAEQAANSRDALSKVIYSRLFDYLVKKVNDALATDVSGMSIGILDIYGFEIFEKNGFEQFCINFVNEKLQQIFIELTLKAEQDEYVAERIQWTPIDYFNNKTVCDLMEAKRPPGIFCVLDDVCATQHAVSDRAEADMLKQLAQSVGRHEHYESAPTGFIVHHYAGKVLYDADGFCDKNKDVLFPDLVILMQSSTSSFVRSLFPEEVSSSKGRPTTAGAKMRSQANALVEALMACTPHYIRCIKPNETKRPRDWEAVRVRHQVEYLGLKENVRVRRAGFAYRRTFAKFLFRYGLLTKDTKNGWRGPGGEKGGVEFIMKKLNVPSDQFQLGITKVFIKAPETLFMLEEQRERKYNQHARVIQKAFKKYFARKQRAKHKMAAADVLGGRKERRAATLNRAFHGDYIGVELRPELQALIGRKEKVLFAEVVQKLDRSFKRTLRDLVLTPSALFLVGREKSKKGPNKGQYCDVIKRKIAFDQIMQISLSPYQDSYLCLHARDSYDSLLVVTFKTEFLYQLSLRYQTLMGRAVHLQVASGVEVKIKKELWGGAGVRKVGFRVGPPNSKETFAIAGKVLSVFVPPGLPAHSRPVDAPYAHSGAAVKLNERPATSGTRVPSRPPSVITSHNQPHQPYHAPQHPNLAPSVQQNTSNVRSGGGGRGDWLTTGQRAAPERITPPPPSDPAPPNQPKLRMPSFNPANVKLKKTKVDRDSSFMQTPASGVSGTKRASLNKEPEPRAVAPAPRPKPAVAPRPKLPKCRALYEYVAQDLDELSFQPGEIIDIVREHDSGWWTGKLKGSEGLFPGNYVEKV